MNKQFRIWNGQKFLNSEYIAISTDGSIIQHHICYNDDPDDTWDDSWNEYDVEGLVTQQFTGSLDKQGNKIFEGDVVLWFGEDPFDATPHSRKMIVGWNQRIMGYRLYEWANQGGGEHFFAEDCQVIGNVFDWQNPECLYQLDKSVKHLGEERLANSLMNNE